MATPEIRVDDIGTTFRVTIKNKSTGEIQDISDATTLDFIFTKANKEIVTKDGTLVTDGSDGKVEYVTLEGDLDVAGTWRLQVYLVLPSGEWRTNKHSFRVHRN